MTKETVRAGGVSEAYSLTPPARTMHAHFLPTLCIFGGPRKSAPNPESLEAHPSFLPI